MYRYKTREKNNAYTLIILIILALIAFAYFYNTNSNPPKNNVTIKNYSIKNDEKPDISASNIIEVAPVASIVEKITPNTEIVYQYYYELDQKTVEEREQPPYYMINMAEEEFRSKYSDWEIKVFSSKQVVMQKNLNGKSPFYFRIGEKDGYIAVYYEKPVNGISLREITDTPVNTLPKDEQDKIRSGITVYGEDELIKILEDYSS
ncbi:MAG TPA: hypothetical protein DEP72_08955 [Clostridiales bacterium]|nr:MAG: hypothetical protein A2Y18_03895 [Clostridiales bacterium GWD2_32_19]HCC08268.1 hypothetical protein [Clostridiales bacterium]